MIRKNMAGLVACAALATACSRGAAPPGARDLAAAEAPLGRAALRVRSVEGGGLPWEVLDSARDGSVLYGLRAEPLPDSDMRVTYLVRFLGREGQSPAPIGGGPLFDAALSPSGDRLLIVASPAGELRVARPGGAFEAIDTGVMPGASLSPDGASVVYAKGPQPELDIYVADLATKAARSIAGDPAPDYLPAFSSDGRRVAFVSARGGFPSIWTVDAAGGPARQLTNVGLRAGASGVVPAPDGREPPLWGHGVLVFWDGAAVRAVDDRTGRVVWTMPGARRPRWLSGDEVALEVDGGHRAVRAAEGP